MYKLVLNYLNNRFLLFDLQKEKQLLDIPVNESLMILKTDRDKVLILYQQITYMFKKSDNISLYEIQDSLETKISDNVSDVIYETLINFRDE